ncbi:odorant receptor 45a-like [Lucilia sericata]|uniref:odorant receptor 45a-like n=1 Tax=Lucilia sericata TaxID=13632 RepID=UPI0018A7FCBD|nr:odorant receptor 45a-like [Lucilia sericata]
MSQDIKLKQKKFFNIPKKTFAVVGIDPLADKKERIIKNPIICCGYYVLTFIFVLACIDFSVKNLDNMNEYTTISVLNQLIIVLWKIAVFWIKRQRICKLIKDIWQWNENVNAEEFRIIEKIGTKTAMISKWYYLAVGAAGLISLLSPLITKLIRLLQGVEGDMELPHQATYLWNISTPWGYIIAFLWDYIIVNFLFNASVAIDTLFIWLASNIIVRFGILKERFKRAAQQDVQTITSVIIIENIKFHSSILDMAQELDAIFGEIIFVKSIVSCTQICFLVFRFMGKDNSLITISYNFVFLIAVAMQLFLYCYSGELIKEESLNVSINVYESFTWCKLTLECQKMLQMIMLRSQRCANIQGLFFNLNLSLYLWFFKTAGSLIAVLQTIEDV